MSTPLGNRCPRTATTLLKRSSVGMGVIATSVCSFSTSIQGGSTWSTTSGREGTRSITYATSKLMAKLFIRVIVTINKNTLTSRPGVLRVETVVSTWMSTVWSILGGIVWGHVCRSVSYRWASMVHGRYKLRSRYSSSSSCRHPCCHLLGRKWLWLWMGNTPSIKIGMVICNRWWRSLGVVMRGACEYTASRHTGLRSTSIGCFHSKGGRFPPGGSVTSVTVASADIVLLGGGNITKFGSNTGVARTCFATII
mmetsp:Transcript_10095/g.14280  ORF Transcript_10095/g.14280 Transcript_10095/m.14280 type:complete len:253 (+) Transcript_10095:2400-3158(+)